MYENEKLYSLLEEFIDKAGISAAQLAERARMQDFVLKECISARSKLTIGTFASIAVGMLAFIEQEGDKNATELRRIYAGFVDEYVESNSEQFTGLTNPHFVQTIVRLGGESGQETVNRKVKRLLGIETEEEEEPPLRQLEALFEQLSPTGQQEVIKRVKEMLLVPEYKK